MTNITSSGIISGFIGGLIIGIASTIHLLLKGRVTGMSGIFNGIITLEKESFLWKSSIMSGLLIASCAAYLIFGFDEIVTDVYLFDNPVSYNMGVETTSLILAGLLVGFGTKLGNGCTSGHGVCGLPRLSVRSLFAVLAFMSTAIIIANIKYYAISVPKEAINASYDPHIGVYIIMGLSVLLLAFDIVINVKTKKGKQGLIDILISFMVGFIFSIGLLISGMARRSKVVGFLTFNNKWDISLMFVLGGAVLFNLFTFHYIIRIKKKPLLAVKLSLPSITKVDVKLIAGASLFGLGWGLLGVCPGPGMIVTPMYLPTMAQFIASMVVGQYGAMLTEKMIAKRNAKHVQSPTLPLPK